MLNKYNNICILYMVLIIYIIAYLYGIINHDLCQCFICFCLCQVKVGNDLFILLFYWFTCFEGQCEILILLI